MKLGRPALQVTRPPSHPDLCTACGFILKVKHVTSLRHLGLIWEMINLGGVLCVWRIKTMAHMEIILFFNFSIYKLRQSLFYVLSRHVP